MSISNNDSSLNIESIQECVTRARNSRLSDHGLEDDQSGTSYEDPPLIGECHFNALALCEALDNAGKSPILVWGALHFKDPNGCSDTTPPQTVSEAESRGAVHFWVEIDDSDRTLIVDISSEIPAQFGESYIDSNLPYCYHRPKNSRFRYESNQDITANQLRNLEGYDHLIEQGLLLTQPPCAG
jgi:hypothetical protein